MKRFKNILHYYKRIIDKSIIDYREWKYFFFSSEIKLLRIHHRYEIFTYKKNLIKNRVKLFVYFVKIQALLKFMTVEMDFILIQNKQQN